MPVRAPIAFRPRRFSAGRVDLCNRPIPCGSELQVDLLGEAFRQELGNHTPDCVSAKEVGELGNRAASIQQDQYMAFGSRKRPAVGRGQLSRAKP